MESPKALRASGGTPYRHPGCVELPPPCGCLGRDLKKRGRGPIQHVVGRRGVEGAAILRSLLESIAVQEKASQLRDAIGNRNLSAPRNGGLACWTQVSNLGK